LFLVNCKRCLSLQPETRNKKPETGRSLVAALLAVFAILPGCTSASGGGSSGAEFLRVAMGARAAALGENFVGLADDVTAAAWNPAGLGQLEEIQLTGMHMTYMEGVSYDFIAGSYPVGKYGSVALSAVYMGVDDFDSTEFGAPMASASDTMVALSWGGAMRTLVPESPTLHGFHYGLTAKFISRSLGGYSPTGAGAESFSANAMAVDVGIMYQALPTVMTGLTVQNLGSTIMFMGDEADALPMALRVGLGWRAIEKSMFRGTVLVDVVKPMDPDGGTFESGTWGGLGVEATIAEILALRFGFRSGADGARVVGGAGISYRGFSLDYAFVPLGDSGVFAPGDFGDAHRFGLTARIGMKPRGLKKARNLAIEALPKRKFSLSWEAVSGAKGYHVGMRSAAAKEFKRLTKRPREKTTLSMRGLKFGDDYVFRVVGVDDEGEEGAVSEFEYSVPALKKGRALRSPRGLAAEAAGSRAVRLTWDAVSGAKGYHIFYRKVGEGKTRWKKLTKSPRKSSRIVLKGLAPASYDFTVSTVNADGKGGKGAKPVKITVE
jgi:hypothetical protein